MSFDVIREDAQKRVNKLTVKRNKYRREHPELLDQTSTKPQPIRVNKLLKKKGPTLRNEQFDGMRRDLIQWNYNRK